MSAPTKEVMAKYLQLNHWNQYLFNNGIITQKEYLKMAEKIRNKYSVA